MISIGICDDEEIHRKYVKELCECYFSEYVQEHEYVEFMYFATPKCNKMQSKNVTPIWVN